MTTSAPDKIIYHQKDKTLKLKWLSEEFSLTAELLRVYSPSADHKNLGDSPPVFESGKSSVQINKISKVGNYAIKFLFDDGHDDGIYSWGYLKKLAENKADYWNSYVDSFKTNGGSRLRQIKVSQWAPKVEVKVQDE